MNLILTFDYELFGSGQGDVFKHLVKPTNYILDTLDELEIKATFFIEYLEILAIFELAKSGNAKAEADALLIRSQLERMIKDGHDLQLHIHPQWYKAINNSDQWILNFSWWRFSSLPFNTTKNGTPGQLDLLKEGRLFLEKLVRPFIPEYQCHIFRAGGYNFGFDKQSITALKEAGFDTESSLCPGFFADKALCQYDYTSFSDYAPFDLKLSGNSLNIIEYPLLTIKSQLIEKISVARLYNKLINGNLKKINFVGPKSFLSPQNSEKLTNSNFDVCLSSFLQINRFFNKAVSAELSELVLIGHAKDLCFFSPFKKILKRAHRYGAFITMSESRKGL